MRCITEVRGYGEHKGSWIHLQTMRKATGICNKIKKKQDISAGNK